MNTLKKTIIFASCMTVGLAFVACSEKNSSKSEKSGVTEFITERVDLNPPKKTVDQPKLTEEELKEAKAIYYLTSEKGSKINIYIPFNSDSENKKLEKEKRLSQASPELKKIIKSIKENCEISSSKRDKENADFKNSISGEKCPVNEQIVMTSALKSANTNGKNQKYDQAEGTYSLTEELKHSSEDVIAITKIKSLKSTLTGTIKQDSALTATEREIYFSGAGKVEVVTVEDKTLELALKLQSFNQYDGDLNVQDSRAEAKVNLSTKKEIIITVIKKIVNEVTIAKKVFANDQLIETERD